MGVTVPQIVRLQNSCNMTSESLLIHIKKKNSWNLKEILKIYSPLLEWLKLFRTDKCLWQFVPVY